MVRIKDVAREAGVAASTVSLVMNKKGYVSEATRAKVEAAMKKLNYVPSEMARNLSLNRTNTIGVILPSISHPFFGEVVEALEAALYEQNYKMMLCCTRHKENAEHTFVEMLKRRTMDGIIMGAHSLDVSKKEENLARFEDKSESQKDSKTPTMKDIMGVFKIADLWKIIGFVIMSWTFYTVFDQQMFSEFFTRFFATPEEGQQAYGVLNSIEVFLEFLMMGMVPVFMKKIGVRKAILLSCCIMILRIGGCGLADSPLGVGIIKLLHAPETALFILAIFRYFTLHFDTRISATLYMVGFQIAAQIGQIIFSAPLGALHDQIGYQQTFLVISGIVCVASLYAFVVLRKDDQCVEGQPLELEAVAE